MSCIATEKAVSEPVEPRGASMTAEVTVSQPVNTLDRVETRASILYGSIDFCKKCIIVFACSWSTLAACFSSTSLLSASKEISEEFNTTSQVVTFSTAGLMMAMGTSALIWSPIASVSRGQGVKSEHKAYLAADHRSKISVYRMYYCATSLHYWCSSSTNHRGFRRHARVIWLPRLLLPCCWSDYHRRVLSSRTTWPSERFLSGRHSRRPPVRSVYPSAQHAMFLLTYRQGHWLLVLWFDTPVGVIFSGYRLG